MSSPEEVTAFVRGLDETGPVGIRFNTLLAPVAAARRELNELGMVVNDVSWSEVSATVRREDRARLVASDAVVQGRVYPQALSSQWAVTVLDPQPGDSVLDLCAAPGGKTLHIAQCVGAPTGDESESGSGRVAAVEPSKPRFFRMKANLKRGGAEWVYTYPHDGRRVGSKTPERFDRVLVDAPCSAESAFSLTDATKNEDWSERKIKRCAARQVQLLESALEAAKVGGVIVYATCTAAPEENEAVVSEVLERRPDVIEVLPMHVDKLPAGTAKAGLTVWRDLCFPDALTQTTRLIPGGGFEAFYVAKLRKIGMNRH